MLLYFNCVLENGVQAALNRLYVSHESHLAKMSPRAFAAYSGKEARRMLLNPLEEIGSKSKAALASLIFGNCLLQ